MRPIPLLLALAASLGTAACASTATPTTRDPDTTAGVLVEVPRIARPAGETPEWWFRSGAAEAAARGAMAGRARNVILFVGDGMSLTTVAAARIFEGQRQGASGEEHQLSWEQFPHTALSKTYNTNLQTPDSAGTMSAMATGIKTRAGVLSIGQQAPRGDCAAARRAPVLTLWELASLSGMAAGVVTNTRVTHATPAATFTHTPDRDWESDATLGAAGREQGCVDIARQLVETPFAQGFDVLLGGGRRFFMPASQRDPEHPGKPGERLDGRDLVAAWQARRGGVYVWNRAQLDAAPLDRPVLGLFGHDHMQFEHDRVGERSGEPSLADMTRAAIARLARNPQGYVLLVEAGRIDHAHHYGNAYRALGDTVALSDAVRAAVQATSADDTLILVTADHAHTLTFAGYPSRGNPILGKVRGSSGEDDAGSMVSDGLGLPYTTLGYANGPGYAGASGTQAEGPKHFFHAGRDYRPATGRPDLSKVDTAHPDYLQEATLPLASETHGGEDVGVWARGPGSHAVRGTLEQHALYHVMLQATPRLRASLCSRGLCDANGVPVQLPDFEALLPPHGQARVPRQR